MNDAINQHSIQNSKEMGAVVAAYRQSGLGLKRFARERGIRTSRRHYWVYQKNQDSKARTVKVKEARNGRTSVFQEVKFEAGSALLPSWAAEVSLAGRLQVRFSGLANPDWIGAVIQTLQRPC